MYFYLCFYALLHNLPYLYDLAKHTHTHTHTHTHLHYWNMSDLMCVVKTFDRTKCSYCVKRMFFDSFIAFVC